MLDLMYLLFKENIFSLQYEAVKDMLLLVSTRKCKEVSSSSGRYQKIREIVTLEGLSHELDWAFDDINREI